MTGISPSVVVPNGGFGSIFSGSQQPFVSGVTPIVGNPYGELEGLANEFGASFRSTGGVFSPGEGPLSADVDGLAATATGPISRGSAASTAERSSPSLAAIRQQKAEAAQAQADEVARLVAESQQYETSGDMARARSRLRSAIKKATGRQRYELQQRLESLSGSR